jgi:hypothetical protein
MSNKHIFELNELLKKALDKLELLELELNIIDKEIKNGELQRQKYINEAYQKVLVMYDNMNHTIKCNISPLREKFTPARSNQEDIEEAQATLKRFENDASKIRSHLITLSNEMLTYK